MNFKKKIVLAVLVGLSSAAFLTFPIYLRTDRPVSFERKEIVLMAVGDVMLDRGVEYKIRETGNNDFRFPFLKISSYLRGADLLFGNLESVVSDKGKKVGSIYSFRADPRAVEGLVYAGFDVLSVANNHVFDYGREAMEDSFFRIKEAGMEYVGGGLTENSARQGVVKEVRGTKISFLGYNNQGSPYWKAEGNKSGINWISEEIAGDIKEAKEKSDLIVVSFHYGTEYQEIPSETQKKFSYLAIDSGADLVVGHHPHVIQPVEKYKKGWIAYSLGNFVFDQYFSEKTMKGLLLEITIRGKEIKDVNSVKVKISEDYQPFVEL